MAKSLPEWIIRRDFVHLLELLEYDPSEPNGLKWKEYSRRRKPIGQTFWVGKNNYQSRQLVLIMNGVFPVGEQTCASIIDPAKPHGDIDNLRWIVHGQSRQENIDRKRKEHVEHILGFPEPSLGERLRLGKLCKNSHTWNGYPLTLQRLSGRTGKKDWKCIECEKQRSMSTERKMSRKQWYSANIQDQREKARVRMQEKRDSMTTEQKQEFLKKHAMLNRAKRATSGRERRNGLYVPRHLMGQKIRTKDLEPFFAAGVNLDSLDVDFVKQQAKIWAELENFKPSPTVAELVFLAHKNLANSEKQEFIDAGGTLDEWRKLLARRRYYKNMEDPSYVMYVRQKTRRRKALLRHRTVALIPSHLIDARFTEFCNCCAYCGIDLSTIPMSERHMEHVVPISKGGAHALDNIVPACRSCNYDKANKDAYEWFSSQPFFTEQRWRKICKALDGRESLGVQLALL